MVHWPGFFQGKNSVSTRTPCSLCRARYNEHRFAVRTLIEWYRAGCDVEREIPKLATYLGHVHLNHTYWYLEGVPELLQLATQRLMEREVRP